MRSAKNVELYLGRASPADGQKQTLLGAAGLLKGYKAATHWASMEFLGAFGATPVKTRAPDYAWGHSHYKEHKAVIEKLGGKVYDPIFVPLDAKDLVTYLARIALNTEVPFSTSKRR